MHTTMVRKQHHVTDARMTSHDFTINSNPSVDALAANCPKCQWGISQAMIDQADGLSRCRRCGMRLGEIINALRHQQEIANAAPPTLEEALMERTGFPIWLGMLLTATVLSFVAIGGLYFRDSSRVKEQVRASNREKEQLQQYCNEIAEMLDDTASINSVSAEFTIGDAIDDLTQLLKGKPECMDDETLAEVERAELRLSELMQLHSEK